MSKLNFLLRSLISNKISSLITIIGFSVSLSMALVIIAFLINESGYDKSYPNIDRIYRVFSDDNNASVREDFKDMLPEKYPSVEAACRYNNYSATLTYDEKPYKGQMVVTDASFFKIFSTQFITGFHSSTLESPDDVVLTESFSRSIFGNIDPVGKTLTVEYNYPLTVTGVIKDLPANSSIKADFFTNSRKKIIYESSSDGSGNEVNFFRLFILAKKSSNIKELEKLLTNDLSSVTYKFGSVKKINLIPFSKSYFIQGINGSQTLHSNLKLLKLLAFISLIIILLAVFNYINLTTASHTGRFKEIGIRKTLGAGKKQVFMQFICESLIVCLLSFFLALFISSIWVPHFERCLGGRIILSNIYDPYWLLMIFCGVIAISFISGLYPALAVSRLKPTAIFEKSQTSVKNKFSLRALLNILQYAVSICLIIAIIILSRQIGFVRTKDYGYKSDQLLKVDIHWRLADRVNALKNELLEFPSIKNLCFSHGSPGEIYMTSSWNLLGGENEIISVLTVDSAFFDVFGLEIISGRKLFPSDFDKVCYINETAYKKTGWSSIEGKKYYGYEIIGVVKDFNFSSLYNKIGPLVIPVSSEMGISHMTIKLSPGNIPQSILILEDTWKKICPGYELKYQFYDDWLNSMYSNEERLSAAIRLFAILAIIISCLGIVGLAEFSIKKRTKEIGIRKVNGARTIEVLTILNKAFLRWVIIGFLIAVPVSWYIMRIWLESFAYRTRLSWWIFAAGGILAMAIALLTVTLQSWRAARRNPVEALRYE